MSGRSPRKPRREDVTERYDHDRSMSVPSPLDVLVVGDDVLPSALIRAIRQHDLSTDTAGTLVEAKRLLARSSYKVVVLDVQLLMVPASTCSTS